VVDFGNRHLALAVEASVIVHLVHAMQKPVIVLGEPARMHNDHWRVLMLTRAHGGSWWC
jgi:hypothetical protein